MKSNHTTTTHVYPSGHRWTFNAGLLGAIMVLLLTASVGFADNEPQKKKSEKKQTRVYPPHQEAFGTTYSDLAMAWWDWALSQPPDKNPIVDQTGEFCHVGQNEDFGQGEHIFFLAGNFGGPDQTVRRCTVPKGKALFFPILNSLWIAPEECDTVECRKIGAETIDRASLLECIVDGVPIEDIFAYRAQSPPGGSPLHIRAGSLLESFDPMFYAARGYLPGSVADGYWLLIKLGEGVEHTVEFRSQVENSETGEVEFQVSVKYLLSVGKRGGHGP